ncbi:unnamed protein product [Nippostrongylus brasiliensis]|uniref:aralkylamine N-acetyltransferase n=1 Tax=Nippostrongylus brasiliensis TaxID=27835 RepID=A0A0N4Y532_NIPBR|nr:unnamed protein product [Nippostrongylus brasiliensis]
MSSLQYSIANKEHAAEIKKFMLEEFRTNEPITASIHASEAETQDFFNDLAESGYSNAKYSTVVHKDSRLVAVCLCSVKTCDINKKTKSSRASIEPHDYGADIAVGPYSEHKANQVMTFVEVLESKQDELLGDGRKVLKIDILGVSKAERGQGIAKRLTEMALDTARSEGCDWVATAATAAASQGIFAKFGFKTMFEVPYSNYLDNGKVVFQDLHDGGQSGKFMVLAMK